MGKSLRTTSFEDKAVFEAAIFSPMENVGLPTHVRSQVSPKPIGGSRSASVRGVQDHVRKSVPPNLIRKGRMRISFEIVDTGVEPVTYSFEGNCSTSELIMYASEYTESFVPKHQGNSNSTFPTLHLP